MRESQVCNLDQDLTKRTDIYFNHVLRGFKGWFHAFCTLEDGSDFTHTRARTLFLLVSLSLSILVSHTHAFALQGRFHHPYG